MWNHFVDNLDDKTTVPTFIYVHVADVTNWHHLLTVRHYEYTLLLNCLQNHSFKVYYVVEFQRF